MEKRRSSGLELLRIFSIIAVIAFHYLMHSGFPPLTVSDVGGVDLYSVHQHVWQSGLLALRDDQRLFPD